MKKLMILITLLFLMGCTSSMFKGDHTGHLVLKDGSKIPINNNLYYGSDEHDKITFFELNLKTHTVTVPISQVKEIHLILGSKQ